MAKHGNGEGTLVHRSDGRWCGVIMLPDGHRKWLYGRTRAQVAQKVAEARRDRDKGLPIGRNERQSVEQYFSSWLATVKPQVKESAWISYEHRVRLYVVPNLGRVSLAKLTPQQLQALYAKLLDRGLSPTTVNHLHGIIHHALKDALRLGEVPRNVAELVDPPSKVKQQMQVYSPEQVRVLLATAEGHRFEALFTLALTTGVRLGELLALKWAHVDFDHGALQVQEGRTRRIEGWADDHPKTDAGRRRILLTTGAVEALRKNRKRQLEERLAISKAWRDNDLVFPNEIGDSLFHSVVERAFYKTAAAAGVPRIAFHDLRHTAATLLLLSRVPVAEVSEMLGHADPSITYRVYAHTLRQGQHQAVAAMESILGGRIRRRTTRA